MLINIGGRNNKNKFGSQNHHNMAWADLFATKNVKIMKGTQSKATESNENHEGDIRQSSKKQ